MALNLERIRENLQKAKEEADKRNAKYFQFKDGRNVIRILEPWDDATGDISRVFAKHWGLGPEGKTAVFCPRVSFGLNCPICDELDRIWKAKPDESTKEWLRKVGATPRHYVNIIDLNDLEKGVQAAEFPKTLIEDVWKFISDPDAGYGDITDWDNGYDLIVDKSGVGLSTRYDITVKRTPTPISKDFKEHIINLDALVKKESRENLLMIWQGKSPAEALPAPGEPRGIPSMTDPDTVDATPDMVSERTPVTPPAAPAPAAPAKGIPPCFGGFNEVNTTCLDCPEQDDCEMRMVEEKRAARAAAKAAATTATATPPPTPAASPATPSPAAAISEDDLMAEMEKAINRA